MRTKTAVIYARVSSIGDRQSTDRQVKDLSDYAVYQKMEVRKVFEEHISGAKKNDERPVLCEAIKYCKEYRIDVLLVSELSRLGRNAFEVLASVKDLLDCGINLYIQKEQQYVAKGGKLGRKPGSVKRLEKKKDEYREVINLLKKGYSIRDVAKLSGKVISTVQRVKKEFIA